MKTSRKIQISRSVLGAGVVALALLGTSGRLTAATSAAPAPVGPADIDALLAPQHTRTEVPIRPGDRPDVIARADKVRDGFGFPSGTTKEARHVHDGLLAMDYDEVAEMDATGKPVSLTQFDGAGLLLTAVRFDNPAGSVVRTTRDGALGSARRGLTQIGLAVVGQPTADAVAESGGWYVHWDRRQDGFAVRGDEVRVRVWPDGSIQSVARVEHQLAAAPSRRLSQAQATQAVNTLMAGWSSVGQAGYALQSLELQWVGPNAAFDPDKLGAAPAPYRLAWVANVKPTGAPADYVSLVTVYLDAGDGTVIGGDFVG
jgi:hypothetical protein